MRVFLFFANQYSKQVHEQEEDHHHHGAPWLKRRRKAGRGEGEGGGGNPREKTKLGALDSLRETRYDPPKKSEAEKLPQGGPL